MHRWLNIPGLDSSISEQKKPLLIGFSTIGTLEAKKRRPKANYPVMDFGDINRIEFGFLSSMIFEFLHLIIVIRIKWMTNYLKKRDWIFPRHGNLNVFGQPTTGFRHNLRIWILNDTIWILNNTIFKVRKNKFFYEFLLIS